MLRYTRCTEIALPPQASSVPPALACLITAATLLGATASATRASLPAVPPPATSSQAQSSPSQPVSGQGAATPTQTAASLTVVATPGVTLPAPNQGTFDFGQVSLLDKTRIEQTFTFRNDANTSLALAHLKLSCGCTSAVVQTKKKGSSVRETWPSPTALPTLAPGDEMSVQLVVDLTPFAPGRLSKTALVHAQGYSQPVATSVITGTLLPSVTFTPAVVDFGAVTAGEARSVILTAAFDPRLASSGPSTPLVSTNPAVRISPETAASASGEPSLPSKDGDSKMPVRAYRVTLAKDILLGALSGILSFAPQDSTGTAAPASSAASRNISAALRSARVALVGQVNGDISAQPQALALGMVPKGQDATQQIVLTGANAAALENLKIICGSSWLSARLDASPAAPAPGEAGPAQKPVKTLAVTLGSGAPAGILQTELNITLANGQRLLIPVNAYVQP